MNVARKTVKKLPIVINIMIKAFTRKIKDVCLICYRNVAMMVVVVNLGYDCSIFLKYFKASPTT